MQARSSFEGCRSIVTKLQMSHRYRSSRQLCYTGWHGSAKGRHCRRKTYLTRSPCAPSGVTWQVLSSAPRKATNTSAVSYGYTKAHLILHESSSRAKMTAYAPKSHKEHGPAKTLTKGLGRTRPHVHFFRFEFPAFLRAGLQLLNKCFPKQSEAESRCDDLRISGESQLL